MTEKKGFSVVAHIMMTRPLSNRGRRVLLGLVKTVNLISRSTSPPKISLLQRSPCRRFLTIYGGVKGPRRTVVPAIAEAIEVLPMPGGRRIIEDRRLASTMRRMIFQVRPDVAGDSDQCQ